MTLQTTGSLSLTDVMNELRVANPSRAYPISLGDADVLALAGKSAPPVSLSDLYGKSSYVAMSGTLPDVSITGSAGPATAYSEHATLTLSLSGGIAPFTFTWTHISGAGSVNANNALSTVANMPVSPLSTPGNTSSQVVQVSVLDGKGNTLTKQCTVTLTLV